MNASEPLTTPRQNDPRVMDSKTGVQELAVVKRQAATGGTCPVAGTPPFPGLRGALPGRVSREWNVVAPLGSGLRLLDR